MIKRALVAVVFVSACEPDEQVIPYGFDGNAETGRRGEGGSVDENGNGNGDPIAIPNQLAPSASTDPMGSCRVSIGDDNVVSWESTWDTDIGHTGGAWYFEVTVEEFEAGWTSIGIAAQPATVMDIFPGGSTAGAVTGNRAAGEVIGIAADLDGERVTFFSNRAPVQQDDLATFPGVGPYVAGALPMSGNVLRFNFGEAPFVFAPPEGFLAYGAGLAADDDGNCISDDGIPSAQANVTGSCSEEALSTYRSSATGDDELIIVGVYESADSILVDEASWTWQSVEGEVVVGLDRPGKAITLVVSSYEPTHWILDVAEGTTVTEVLVDGYEPQRVTTSAPVTELGGYFGARQWPFSTGGLDEQGLVNSVQNRTSLEITAFAGCYQGNEFRFSAD